MIVKTTVPLSPSRRARLASLGARDFRDLSIIFIDTATEFDTNQDDRV